MLWIDNSHNFYEEQLIFSIYKQISLLFKGTNNTEPKYFAIYRV